MPYVDSKTPVIVENGGKQRIVVPGNNHTAYVQVMGAPMTGRTNEFAELKRQLDAADADIMLVNKRLDEAQGMYSPVVNRYVRGA